MLIVLMLITSFSSRWSQSQNHQKVAEEKIHMMDIDQYPFFKKCRTKECSDTKLIKFIFKNLKYPKKAPKSGTQGRVYIQFVVEKDGSMSDIKIARDVKDDCGLAALNTVKKMNNKWTPGMKDGQPIRVLYTLPVTFQLPKK